MIRVLGVEFQKTRHRKMGWVIFALLAAQAAWSLWSSTYLDAEDLKQGWMYILFQFPLLDSLMMPVIIAVVASRLCDVEHKGQTFRLIHTLMPAGSLFDAKFLSGTVYLLAAAAFQLIIMLAAGILRGFEGEIPWLMLAAYFLLSSAVNLTLLVLQQSLSLLFSNQIITFTVGLIGAFFGLFSLYFPPGLQNIAPWGYYGVLMLVHMDWDPATRISNYYWSPLDWGGLIMLAVMFMVIYLTGRRLFVRKEH